MHRLQRARAYRQARYRVLLNPPLDLYVGQRRAPDEARLRHAAGVRRSWAILSACNLGSKRQPEAVNAHATRKLHRALSGLRPRPRQTIASDPTGAWPEPGLLLADPSPKRLHQLARRLRQNAVLCGRLGRLPGLCWVCRGGLRQSE